MSRRSRLLVFVGLLSVLLCLAATRGPALAQKGKAAPDWYPKGYDGDTWTGEVTAFDNDQRTLTLTSGTGKKAQTFVASLPNAPYEWARDGHNARVLDFPYNKQAKAQTFVYVGPGFAGTMLPETEGERGASGQLQRPNPPASNVINDLAEFMGRTVTVYYTPRERKENNEKVKYNDVWRIRIDSAKKK